MDYYKIDALNFSTLKKYLKDNEDRPDPVEDFKKRDNPLRFGRAVHAKILEDKNTDCHDLNLRLKADRETLEGLDFFVYKEEWDTILAMREAISKKGEGSVVFNELIRQNVESIFVINSKQLKKDLKCRVDTHGFIDNKLVLCDYKTVRCANPYDAYWTIQNYNYDMQAVFYSMIVAKSLNKEVDSFLFVMQEKKPPYLSCFMQMKKGSDVWQGGRLKIDIAINNYINKRNNFYTGDILELEEYRSYK